MVIDGLSFHDCTKVGNSRATMTDSYSSAGHGEPAKPCRSCYKFSEWMNMQRASAKKEKSATKVDSANSSNGQQSAAASSSAADDLDHSHCPLDKDGLGRSTWGLLHTMAAAYPEKPTDDDRNGIRSFMTLLGKFYPCDFCAKDLRQDLVTEPPATENQNSLAQWMCRLHNRVNQKMGKPTFDCSKVNERWKDGPPDGSCG